MTNEQRHVFDLPDILALRIECAGCQTTVAIDPAKLNRRPDQCPSCGQTWRMPFGSDPNEQPVHQFVTGLARLRQQDAKKANLPLRLRFEIAQSED